MFVHPEGSNSSPGAHSPPHPAPPSTVSPTDITTTTPTTTPTTNTNTNTTSTNSTTPTTATVDKKIAFGQLRQSVSSQLCDLLESAGIHATRIVSGRRFVRWEVVPPLLYQHSKYISSLPLEFFFNKTSHVTDVHQLHAHPLNINILSWKKGTIEDILDRVKDGRIRILDRPQGRDVIFELVGPDATPIDVGKWPDTTVQSETGVLRTLRPSKTAKAARSLKPTLSMPNAKPNGTHSNSTQDVHSEFIAYSPSADVKPEVSDDDLNSPLHQQLPQQKPSTSQQNSISDTVSIIVPPPPGKKWSRRSSPDRIFMNQALNDILRTAGMPIPRQKDDTSRLPWSSIPLFLAQHGLYITNFPEANLPWVYSVENIQAKNREDWIDRVDWKSSPSQRAYKGLVAALRRGEIQIKRRPDGRDVIFEVKDTEGRTYDSTLGLSDAWKQLNMYGDGRKLVSVPGATGNPADGGMADGHRPGIGRLEDEYEMMDLEERGSDSSGSGPRPGHRRYHTNGKDHSPRHIDNEHPIAQQGRRDGGGSPPSSSWPPTIGYSQSQAHSNYSTLGRPGPQQHRSSGSPLSYHPTVNDPEFMSRGRPHHTDHTSLARYHLSSSNSRRGTPYSRHSSPKFNGGCVAEGIVDLPPLDLSRGEREIQREKEEIGHGHGFGTTLPPIKDPQHHHNIKIETGDRLLSPPYSPPARLPPVLQDREYERDRESRRDRDEEMRDGEAAYHTPPRTASHSSGPPLPPRIPRQQNSNPPPPDHTHTQLAQSQSQSHSRPNPTHLPHPQGSSTPFWSPPEKTWKLSLTPELLGSLPPVSHPDIYWDTARGRWILVSGSDSGSPPPAYWSISQGAWVLDFTGGLGLRA